MIPPAGVECRYYYADYYRGREREECRLIAQNRESDPWRPELCKSCSVPGILRANACPHLILEGRVERRLLGLSRRVAVAAVCSKHLVAVAEPHVGCGHCHPDLPIGPAGRPYLSVPDMHGLGVAPTGNDPG